MSPVTMGGVARIGRRRPLALALLLLAGVGGFLAFRWWVGPTPESEAQRYFDERAPGVVRVIDCEYVEDPEGSEFDRYVCVLQSDGLVRHPPGLPHIGTITPGRRAYCFSIPRAAPSPLSRFDIDAAPGGLASDARECAWGAAGVSLGE